jgi:hypothetical protein
MSINRSASSPGPVGGGGRRRRRAAVAAAPSVTPSTAATPRWSISVGRSATTIGVGTATSSLQTTIGGTGAIIGGEAGATDGCENDGASTEHRVYAVSGGG